MNPPTPAPRSLSDSERDGRRATTPSEELCLSCGMCCDGTLFDGVQLERGDSAEKLTDLGLPVMVFRAKNPIARFAQPCDALCADRSCRLYHDRPRQCRTFECGVFKKTKKGEMEFAAGQRLVRKARRQADKMRRLMRKLGDTDEERSLGERFHRMQCRFEADASDADALAIFADISLAMHRLKLIAHEHFYTRAEKPRDPPAPMA